jgi:hypothetical protein
MHGSKTATRTRAAVRRKMRGEGIELPSEITNRLQWRLLIPSSGRECHDFFLYWSEMLDGEQTACLPMKKPTTCLSQEASSH